MSDVKTWAKAGSTSPATAPKTSPKAPAKGEAGKKPKVPLEHVTEAMEKRFMYEYGDYANARATTQQIADHFHISVPDALKLMKKAEKAGHVTAEGRVGFQGQRGKFKGKQSDGGTKHGLMLWVRDMSGGKSSEPIKTYDPKTGKST